MTKHIPGLLAWLVLAALGLMAAGSILSATADWFTDANTVTLKAPPRGDSVTMFFELRETGGPIYYVTLRDGTRCTKLAPTPRTVGAGDTAMRFWHLNCQGRQGYANVLWVDAD